MKWLALMGYGLTPAVRERILSQLMALNRTQFEAHGAVSNASGHTQRQGRQSSAQPSRLDGKRSDESGDAKFMKKTNKRKANR
jgi:hypothetical protein